MRATLVEDELRVVDDPGRQQGGRLSGPFLSQVISTGVQIVAIPWLTGSAVAKAVVADAAVSVSCQEKHLGFEGIGIAGPPWLNTIGCPLSLPRSL